MVSTGWGRIAVPRAGRKHVDQSKVGAFGRRRSRGADTRSGRVTAQGQRPRGPESDREGLVAAPARRSDEGKGPYKSLVLRGAMLIDGTGGPPRGPVDIIIENNRIASIRSAGTPGLPMRTNRAPERPDFEIDAAGMYVLPGFVDLHVHAGGPPKNAEAEYAYKLWLAHGVTTVRGVSLAGQRSRRARRTAAHGTRSWRPASSTISGREPVGMAVDRFARESSRVRPLGGEEQHRRPEARLAPAGDHGSALRRSEDAGARHDRPSRADRRRADERDQGGPRGPRHGHALLRPLRVAAERLRGSALAGRHEL